MLAIANLASSSDQIVTKVHLRCRGCLEQVATLATIDRPPGPMSSAKMFQQQQLWRRMSFQCAGCGHHAADFLRLLEVAPEELIDRSDPYPQLPKAQIRAFARTDSAEVNDGR